MLLQVMEKGDRIFVAGLRTPIGMALVEELRRQGYSNVVPADGHEPDPIVHAETLDFFQSEQPKFVFVAAGSTAGIVGNINRPADLMHHNLIVASHLVDCAHKANVAKLLYLASSCCYPRDCPQPMRPEYLLAGPVEPTNEAYAVAKIAGIKLCQAYRRQYGRHFVAAIPSNPYGPGDEFDPQNSHVIEALVRKMHEAKTKGEAEVQVWGTGTPRRDFIYTHDLADACIHVMNTYDGPEPINLGLNQDISIAELAEAIKAVVGYEGKIVFDATKPDGMPRKCLDSSRLASLGWKSNRSLQQGLSETYRWFIARRSQGLV